MSGKASVLVTKRSEPKSIGSKGERRKKRKPPDDRGSNNAALPFPIALKIANEDTEEVIWPLNLKQHQPFFAGKLNKEDATVDILDPASVECLHRMGFFGRSSLVKRNMYQLRQNSNLLAPIRHIIPSLEQHHQQQQQHQNEPQQPNLRHGEQSHHYSKQATSSQKCSLKKKRLSNSPFGTKQKQWYSLYRAFTGTIPTKEHLVKGLYGSSAPSDCQATSLSIACGFENESHLDCELESSSDHPYSDSSSDVDSHSGDFFLDGDTLMQTNEDVILKLTLEEAFFLSYGLSVLTVYHGDDATTALNLEQMWTLYTNLYNEHDPLHFVSMYSAYHYFRSKGWVVNDGFKFGCDLVIYKEGPPFYHSLFSITVITVRKNSPAVSLDWHQISGKVRVSRAVHKEPTLCYVILPEDLADSHLALPNVIERISIQCLHLERWPVNRNSESNIEGDNDSD